MGHRFVALQYMTIHYFGKHSWEPEFFGKAKPENPKTLISLDDSTVCSSDFFFTFLEVH